MGVIKTAFRAIRLARKLNKEANKATEKLEDNVVIERTNPTDNSQSTTNNIQNQSTQVTDNKPDITKEKEETKSLKRLEPTSKVMISEAKISIANLDTTAERFGAKVTIPEIQSNQSLDKVEDKEEKETELPKIQITDLSSLLDSNENLSKKIEGIQESLQNISKDIAIRNQFEGEKIKAEVEQHQNTARELEKYEKELHNANAEAKSKVIPDHTTSSTPITVTPEVESNVEKRKPTKEETDRLGLLGTIVTALGGLAGFFGIKGAWDDPDSKFGNVLHNVFDKPLNALDEWLTRNSNLYEAIKRNKTFIEGELTQQESESDLTEASISRKNTPDNAILDTVKKINIGNTEEIARLNDDMNSSKEFITQMHHLTKLHPFRDSAPGSYSHTETGMYSLDKIYSSKMGDKLERDDYNAIINEANLAIRKFIPEANLYKVDRKLFKKNDLYRKSSLALFNALLKQHRIAAEKRDGNLMEDEYVKNLELIKEKMREQYSNILFNGNRDAYIGALMKNPEFESQLKNIETFQDAIQITKENPTDTKASTNITTAEFNLQESTRRSHETGGTNLFFTRHDTKELFNPEVDKEKILYGPNKYVPTNQESYNEYDESEGLSRDDVIAYAMQRFKDAGLSDEQAAGIVGNLMQEGLIHPGSYSSKYNDPSESGSKGESYGIAMFRKPVGDANNLEAWAKTNGVDHTTLGGQLDYLTHLFTDNVSGSDYGSKRKHIDGVPQGTKVGFMDAISGFKKEDEMANTVRSWVSKYEKCAGNTNDDSIHVKPRFENAKVALSTYEANKGNIKDLYSLTGFKETKKSSQKGQSAKVDIKSTPEKTKVNPVETEARVNQASIIPTQVFSNKPTTRVKVNSVVGNLKKSTKIEVDEEATRKYRVQSGIRGNEGTQITENQQNNNPTIIDAHQEKGGDTIINNNQHYETNNFIYSDAAKNAETGN